MFYERCRIAAKLKPKTELELKQSIQLSKIEINKKYLDDIKLLKDKQIVVYSADQVVIDYLKQSTVFSNLDMKIFTERH